MALRMGLEWTEVNDHPFVLMEHHTGLVVVDKWIAPVIQTLWDNMIDTAYSCQGGWHQLPGERVSRWTEGNVVIMDRRQTSNAHRLLVLAGLTGVYVFQWPNRFDWERGSLRFNGMRGPL